MFRLLLYVNSLHVRANKLIHNTVTGVCLVNIILGKGWCNERFQRSGGHRSRLMLHVYCFG